MQKNRVLSELKVGERAVIQGFQEGNISLKLLEMGCLPGTEVCLSAVAPLGCPVCLTIGDYTLALRLDEAATIEIMPLP